MHLSRLASGEDAAYLGHRLRAGRPPSRFALIPVGLIAALMGTLYLDHRHRIASIPPPPALTFFDGLPVTGSVRDALREGFTTCIDFNTSLRCRKNGVMLLNHGPFNAAVDMAGSDGRGGFYQLTLWHDLDKQVASDFARDLERQGWHSCLTMLHNWGDQNILRRSGSPVRISVDLSFYSKRRIRIIPERFAKEPHCE